MLPGRSKSAGHEPAAKKMFGGKQPGAQRGDHQGRRRRTPGASHQVIPGCHLRSQGRFVPQDQRYHQPRVRGGKLQAAQQRRVPAARRRRRWGRRRRRRLCQALPASRCHNRPTVRSFRSLSRRRHLGRALSGAGQTRKCPWRKRACHGSLLFVRSATLLPEMRIAPNCNLLSLSVPNMTSPK